MGEIDFKIMTNSIRKWTDLVVAGEMIILPALPYSF